MWFGIVLIVVGVVFLLQNLGYVTGDVWKIVWPAFIILIGISMLFKEQRGRIRKINEDEKRDK